MSKCPCVYNHGKLSGYNHSLCYKAEEHVCTPCECDCHYEKVA